ncbi:NAD-dependent epimerase/dehydratase family protein [Haloferula sp. A504]|uniref:NAD-dependent epimerase/dehydratase family protein n=1 Tax=Haloferula sp. A504 TaxID=3373601 RepID=UPI0031BF8BB6|nr:NAD-dependent epimerase/dehydratase family protein [Verrucomicrobiaceae bacterium E54]
MAYPQRDPATKPLIPDPLAPGTPSHLLLCGHGYVGQATTRDFLAAGWQVTAINRGSGCGGSPQAVEAAARRSNLSSLTADLSSREDIHRLAAAIPAPDFIVHCASSGRGGAEAYRHVYLDGCRHLLEAFPGVPLLFTSSTSVYGQTDGRVVTEESPAQPDRETGHLLRETEDLVLSHDGIVFRLAGIYGPHRSVILKKFLAGESTLEEDGRRFLNQIHRDDAASAILHAATTSLPGGLYNVADSHPRSQLDTFTALAELFDRPLPPSVPRDLNRKRGWTHKQVSNAKLRAAGWEPRHPDFLKAAESVAASLG